jgi:hypothetical protein
MGAANTLSKRTAFSLIFSTHVDRSTLESDLTISIGVDPLLQKELRVENLEKPTKVERSDGVAKQGRSPSVAAGGITEEILPASISASEQSLLPAGDTKREPSRGGLRRRGREI